MGNDLAILREKTVLCRVSGNAYGMTRVDRLVKARAVQDGALPPNTVVTVPTAPEFAKVHAELVAAQYAARSALRHLSIPYGDDEGWRILPHTLMAEFLQAFATHKGKFNAALSDLKAKLIPTMVTLGHVYDETDATASADVDAKVTALTEAYTLTWRMQDYPAGTFAGMSEKSAQTLAQRFEGEMARVVATAKQEPAQRLAGPVQHLAERVRAYDAAIAGDPKGMGRVSLRSSMVENLNEAVRLARLLNIFPDSRVDDHVLEQVNALALCDVALLREEGKYRQGVLQMAADVARLLESHSDDPLLTLAG